MSTPNPAALAALIAERLHETYDDGGEWDIKANAVDGVVAIALEDERGAVYEFRAVLVEGDDMPVVAARPDITNRRETRGPDMRGLDMGWFANSYRDCVAVGGGDISHAESRRMGAALLAIADAHDDAARGGGDA